MVAVLIDFFVSCPQTAQTAVTITFEGRTSPADVVYATPENTPYDLAVIKVRSTAGLKNAVEFKKPAKVVEKGKTYGYRPGFI